MSRGLCCCSDGVNLRLSILTLRPLLLLCALLSDIDVRIEQEEDADDSFSLLQVSRSASAALFYLASDSPIECSELRRIP